MFVSIFSGSNLVFYSISSQPSFALALWTRPQSSPLFGAQQLQTKQMEKNTHTHVQQVREKIMALDENAVFTATLRSDTDLITQWLALKILTMDNSFQVQCFYPPMCCAPPNVHIVATLKITCSNRRAHGARTMHNAMQHERAKFIVNCLHVCSLAAWWRSMNQIERRREAKISFEQHAKTNQEN